MRLVLILHGLIGSTLASVGVVVALVAGVAGVWPLLAIAFGGWLLGWPVAIYVARAMRD